MTKKTALFCILSFILFFQPSLRAESSAQNSQEAPKKQSETYSALEEGTTTETAATDWKGERSAREMSFGALAGLGDRNGDRSFTVVGDFSKKMLHRGFIPEINNQVFLEAMFGPLFVSTILTAWIYSGHLRWDIQKSTLLTFYALGGAAGNFTSSEFQIYPRFGIGVFLNFLPEIRLRAEVSHELIVAGMSYELY